MGLLTTQAVSAQEEGRRGAKNELLSLPIPVHNAPPLFGGKTTSPIEDLRSLYFLFLHHTLTPKEGLMLWIFS